MQNPTVRIPLSIASSASLMVSGVNQMKLLLALSSEREAGYTHGEGTVSAISFITGIKRQNIAKTTSTLNDGFSFRFDDGEYNAVDAASVTGDYGSRIVRVDFSRDWELRAVGECIEIAVDEFRRYRNKASLLLRLRAGAMTAHTRFSVSKTYRPKELHFLTGSDILSASHALEALIQPGVDELRHLNPLFDVSVHAVQPRGPGANIRVVQLKAHKMGYSTRIYPIVAESPPSWLSAPGRLPQAKKLNPRKISTHDRRPRNELGHLIPQAYPVVDPTPEPIGVLSPVHQDALQHLSDLAIQLSAPPVQPSLPKPTRAVCMSLEAKGDRWAATKLCLDYARYPVSPRCEPLPDVADHDDLAPALVDQTRRNVLDGKAQHRWYETMVACGLLAKSTFAAEDEDEEPCLDADF